MTKIQHFIEKKNKNISLGDSIQRDRIMYDYYVVYRTKIFYLHDDGDDDD
jgi:hypothetical protein